MTAFDAMLPDTLSDDAKKSIYIRWIGDATTELLGPSSAGDTEGFYLADVFVYADEIHVDDFTAPQLLSSTPAQGSNNASANGNIVLTFDEKVQAGTRRGNPQRRGTHPGIRQQDGKLCLLGSHLRNDV